jgi:hypothetical protein
MKVRWSVFGAAALALAVWSSSAMGQIPNANHYLCHKTRDLKVPAKFTSVPGISAIDDVGNFSCEAKKPFFLCNPVNKNGSGIVDANLRYCCYKIKCTPNKIKTNFDVTDQFGPLRLETGKASLLCNPCTGTLAP